MFIIEDGRDSFYQWDLNRRLIVRDNSITEVHFCNRTDECSLVVEVYEENGSHYADVPNILLQTDWRINVYAFDSEYTKHSMLFHVNARTKPADYVYTETEVKTWDVLAEQIQGAIDEFSEAEEERAAAEATRVENEINRETAFVEMEQTAKEAKEATGLLTQASQLYANALKGTANGEAIAITDASPIEHEMGVKVWGKNLANIIGFSADKMNTPETKRKLSNSHGTTLLTTEPNNSIEIIQSQTTNNTITHYSNGFFHIGTYIDSKASSVTISFDVDIKDNPLNTSYFSMFANDANLGTMRISSGKCSKTIEISPDISWYDLELRLGGCSCVISNIQIEEGTTATDYAPYVEDISTVKVKKYGKNLANVTSILGTTITNNGGTLSCGLDSGITGSGTPTGAVLFPKIRWRLPKDTYALSAIGEFSNIASALYICDKDANILGSTGVSDSKKSVVFNLNEYPTYSYVDFEIKRTKNDVEMSGTVYFQLETGSTATAYEPYIEPIEYPVSADGTVEGVTPIYPTTTLMTDTAGAVIDCTYNRDINKAFEELTQALASMGANI